MNGSGGLPIEQEWWKRLLSDFKEQVQECYSRCSAAIPMDPVGTNQGKDLVSPSVEMKLIELDSPKYKKGKVEVMDKVCSREEILEKEKNWKPWSHRPFRQVGSNMFMDDDGKVVDYRVYHDGN